MSDSGFTGETSAERRRFPRRPMKLQVRVQRLDRDQVSESRAHLADDLGAGGLALHSEQSLETGQILMATLFLPLGDDAAEERPVPEDRCSTVGILSRVAWCTPDPAGGFRLGVQFLDLDRDDRKRLKDFLVNYRLDDSDSSLYA